MTRSLFTFLFLALYFCGVSAASAEELHILNNGEIHFIGAELSSKNALNFFTVTIWGQRWLVSADYATRFESAGGVAINPEELRSGHALEVKGRVTDKNNYFIDAALVRDLSINKGVQQITSTLAPETISQEQPPASKSPQLTQDLRLGMRGKEVVILQEFLQKNNLGIPNDGPVTGKFGKVTQRALINFQKGRGLAAVGVAGPETRKLINSLLSK